MIEANHKYQSWYSHQNPPSLCILTFLLFPFPSFPWLQKPGIVHTWLQCLYTQPWGSQRSSLIMLAYMLRVVANKLLGKESLCGATQCSPGLTISCHGASTPFYLWFSHTPTCYGGSMNHMWCQGLKIPELPGGPLSTCEAPRIWICDIWRQVLFFWTFSFSHYVSLPLVIPKEAILIKM